MKRIIFCSSLVCSLILMSFFQTSKSGITKVSKDLYKLEGNTVKLTKEDDETLKKSIMEAYGLKSLNGVVKLDFIEGEASLKKGWDYRQIVSTRHIISQWDTFAWKETKSTEKMQKPLQLPLEWSKYEDKKGKKG